MAVSARMLYQLANREGGFRPAKYFSIDRVFRNETMDSTHLREFHQVEGLVADYDLNLGNLKCIIRTFFAEIGITQLRITTRRGPREKCRQGQRQGRSRSRYERKMAQEGWRRE